MMVRKALLTSTILMLPLAAEAQAPAEPVTGPYVGVMSGFNVKSNPNINNLTGNRPGGAVVATPNGNLSTGIGAAYNATLGYGLGNGLRIEIQGDWLSNNFTKTSGNHRAGAGVSTSVDGRENIYGPMVNVDY